MKYYIIAGEASGDLHGSNLIRGLLKSDPQAEFRFWGGDRMAEAAGRQNLRKHYKEASFMGFWEVFKNLPTIFSQLGECRKDILDYRPDAVILIDYAGFNLKIARFAKAHGIPTCFYIAPKVWAWKEGRVKKIRKYVDRLFVIFPFEVAYFKKWGIDAVFCGNPLMDSIDERNRILTPPEQFRLENELDERPIVALLAGSRRHEIDYNFPFMIELASHFPDYQFVVAGVSWLDRSVYQKYSAGSGVKFVQDKTYELLARSEAAVVTSGTATLETALLNVPEFVCFRCSWLSYAMAKHFIRVKYISLVNLIMNRPVVKELIQGDMNMENAVRELKAVLPGGSERNRLLADYAELRRLIGQPGASERVADKMVETVKNIRARTPGLRKKNAAEIH